jgi:hypothetical protein
MTISRIPSVEGGIQPTLLTAKGDLISATAASTVARLPVGSDAQILVADSTASTGLKWATPAGGGKVLQVVYASTTTLTTVSTTTLTDTTLTATITPTLASSKILVIANVKSFAARSGNYISIKARLLRGATTILDYPDDAFNGVTAGSVAQVELGVVTPMTILDTPATTSATTYKVQGAVQLVPASVAFQYAGGPSTITLLEIGA